MSRKIGAELFHFWGGDDQKIIDNMKYMRDAGFECVFWPLLLNEQARMEKYLQVAADLGLEIDELHEMPTNINHIWYDDENGDPPFQLAMDSIDFCADHGVEKMVMHESSGRIAPDTSNAGLQRFRTIFEHAKERGVKVAVENLRRTNHLARIFHECRDLPVYYCWDSGHELCYSPGVDHLALFPEKLICTHVHDNRGLFMFDDHYLPFDGVNDWERDARLIKESGYKGNICGEIKRTDPRYADLSDQEFCKIAYERLKKFVDMCDN